MDLHTEMILEEYRSALPVLEQLKGAVLTELQAALNRSGLIVTALEARVKTEQSLAGKLALKGGKYASLTDITDLVGAHIVTLYTDDVDRIASMAEQLFDIDWENSVDKGKLHQLDSFGYDSLHYICRMPGYDFRFELQLRTTLQHAWAAINHDSGYKSNIDIPREFVRRMNRIAGMLEMADYEFSRIRSELGDYRRRMQQLMAKGQLDEVQLDGDSFRSYMQAKPFEILNKRIAAINQAEIQDVPLNAYLPVLKALGCNTLGDVARLRNKYEDDAYLLARHQLGNTDLDIISSSIGLQNICIVCILSVGGGKIGLERLFDELNGQNSYNAVLAEITFNQASNLPFMKA